MTDLASPLTRHSRFFAVTVVAKLSAAYLTCFGIEIAGLFAMNAAHEPHSDAWRWGTEAVSLIIPLIWLRKYGLAMRSPRATAAWIVPVVLSIIAASNAFSIAKVVTANFQHVFDILLLVPIGEELLFRGVFWGGLGLITTWPVQLVVTSIAFMLMHGTLSWYFFAMGMLFGSVRLGGSVLPCIATHSLFNILAVSHTLW